jgi:hypothetical protein
MSLRTIRRRAGFRAVSKTRFVFSAALYVPVLTTPLELVGPEEVER